MKGVKRKKRTTWVPCFTSKFTKKCTSFVLKKEKIQEETNERISLPLTSLSFLLRNLLLCPFEVTRFFFYRCTFFLTHHQHFCPSDSGDREKTNVSLIPSGKPEKQAVINNLPSAESAVTVIHFSHPFLSVSFLIEHHISWIPWVNCFIPLWLTWKGFFHLLLNPALITVIKGCWECSQTHTECIPYSFVRTKANRDIIIIIIMDRIDPKMHHKHIFQRMKEGVTLFLLNPDVDVHDDFCHKHIISQWLWRLKWNDNDYQ